MDKISQYLVSKSLGHAGLTVIPLNRSHWNRVDVMIPKHHTLDGEPYVFLWHVNDFLNYVVGMSGRWDW